MSRKIKVGLIGYGLSGRIFHGPLIRQVPELELSQILTSRQAEAKLDFPTATLVSDIESLLKSDVELVVVTSPNTEHFKHTKLALLAGKHVVCEKPFVEKIEQAKELIELAERQKKCLSVFQNRRFDGDFLAVKDWVRNHTFGDWVFFESRFDRFRPELPAPDQRRWRDRPLPMSGVFWDLGPHLIDQAVCLFGFPKDVHLQLLFQRKNASVDDGFILTLGYDKKTVLLRSSSNCAISDFRMHLDGQKGGAQISGLDGQEEALKLAVAKSGVTLAPKKQMGKTFDGETEKTIEIGPGNYLRFYTEMRDAILMGHEVPVLAQEAADVIFIMDQAIKSNFLGQKIQFKGHNS